MGSLLSKDSVADEEIRNKQETLESGIVVWRARGCEHLVHPGTSDYSLRPICPRCNIKFWIQEMKDCQKDIRKYGDQKSWEEYVKAIRGKRTAKERRQSAEALGWRNIYAAVLNVKQRYEKEMEKELEWESSHPDVCAFEKLLWEENSCQAALRLYQEEESRGLFTQVQEVAQHLMYLRGLQYASNTGSIKSRTSEHSGFQDKVSQQRNRKRSRHMDQRSVTDSKTEEEYKIEGQPERKRIRFSNEVAVRADADVDVLRRSEQFTRSNPHKRAFRIPSILLPHNSERVPLPLSKEALPTPDRPQFTMSLNDTPQNRSRRLKPRCPVPAGPSIQRNTKIKAVSHPGSKSLWATFSEGRTLVNTSWNRLAKSGDKKIWGDKHDKEELKRSREMEIEKDWAEFERKCRDSQAEAEEWDRLDTQESDKVEESPQVKSIDSPQGINKMVSNPTQTIKSVEYIQKDVSEQATEPEKASKAGRIEAHVKGLKETKRACEVSGSE